jgi:hypothetical protein
MRLPPLQHLKMPVDLIRRLAVELEIEFDLRGAVGHTAPRLQLFGNTAEYGDAEYGNTATGCIFP